jgi:hypothetical protein
MPRRAASAKAARISALFGFFITPTENDQRLAPVEAGGEIPG